MLLLSDKRVFDIPVISPAAQQQYDERGGASSKR
jgi:hypothetical protein